MARRPSDAEAPGPVGPTMEDVLKALGGDASLLGDVAEVWLTAGPDMARDVRRAWEADALTRTLSDAAEG